MTSQQAGDPIQIPYLEMLITNQCNLHCDGCANYANYALKGEVAFDQTQEYLRLWSRRVKPETFRILGGEPTIHKNLIDYIKLAAELWPTSDRIVVTNGGFIRRQEGLLEALQETNTALHLSFHSSHPQYLEWLRPIISVLKYWGGNGVRVSFSDYRQFHRLYRGVGAAMRPFEDNSPLQSWLHCPANNCKVIWNGRLWKCPPIALLRTALKKFEIEDAPEWAPYLAYNGLGLDASNEALQAFLQLRPEGICNMCPKDPQRYTKDIYNTNWKSNAERVEWDGEPVDINAYINSIEAAPSGVLAECA